MRVLVKGGVWKNSEDEILKAAIMKYGKNQWPRVASLLPRKTAKQCKRRWNEWLDPMIKKTEWTREEDEKLLHLTKLMPTQWRTIAPMVGRTPGQCLERYGQLLDMAGAGEDQGQEGEADRARNARLDRLDTNPEDKPARPDPIDMDDDEKEMLSEAKARLANVNGKKAKRKAREKLLENARRMAKLQKYRELKAAGMSSHRALLDRREKGEIDYAAEIPFERRVPIGFYDTTEEQEEGVRRANTAVSRKRLLEAANDDPNKRRKATDAAVKREREKFDKLAKDNLEQALKLVDERNGDLGNSVRAKRIPLVLPAPQVSDQDIDIIAKLGRKRPRGVRASGTGADLLDGTYAAQESAARRDAMRTPVAPDLVMEEARNHVKRSNAQTPLEGGKALPIDKGTGFAGSAIAPSVRLAPSVTTAAAAAAAELGVRDHLRINQEVEPATEALPSRREAKAQRKAATAQLRAGLKGLPEPKYDHYEGQFASEAAASDGEEDAANKRSEDAAHLEKVERERRIANEKHRLLNRTDVAKRELPIPTTAPPQDTAAAAAAVDLALVSHVEEASLRETIAGSWAEEIHKLVDDDAHGRDRKRPAGIEAAFELLRNESRELFGDAYENPDLKAFGKQLELAHASLRVAPSEVRVSKGRKNKTKLIAETPFTLEEGTVGSSEEARAFTFHAIEARIQEMERQRAKLVDRATKLTLGLQQRAARAAAAFKEAQASLETSLRNQSTFAHMQQIELAAIPNRLEDWQQRAMVMEARERELQQAFVDTM
ncbi:Cell division cycle 5-like protein [Hondaea fermentalgiana]|uniref:Cell division cycle 5-like protein n=1 Tax=Hondaea fermentalgiana TaxID=2315210 RepID=A0A2R5GJV9_9STRA|nr:Cell division cycle 5-like protein [Hondaea fermentalgiana]|eukprot:GBG31170.1 Cell division cycle 5-like protein [Hondaea fermentalgiana]